MDQRALLNKTIALAKTGDKEAFENLYILTVPETYEKIRYAVRDGRQADELLTDTYVMLYRHAHELPLGKAALEERIDDEICRIAYKKFGIDIHDLYYEEGYHTLSEDRAATLWLKIEQKAGLNKKTGREEGGSAASYLYAFMKIILTAAVLAAAVFILYTGWNIFYGGVKKREVSSTAAETQQETEAASITIEKDLQEPGWERRPDGSLYYVRQDGTPADRALALGKQILTFSAEGELTLIGNNPSVSENPNLSFDEEIRYEVRDADIYKKDPATGEEICVVRNGHVIQADVRCGFLWYISQYQVPNSNQVKTTLYRAETNGEKQEELYTTDHTLRTEQFQITADWMYFISEGKLLRRNLRTNAVEMMAENVENYFAWENTAYYMNGRTLETVSEGQNYSDVEAGYRIEMQEKGLVLLDALGEPVLPDENGEKRVEDRIYRMENGVIASVRPAERESGGTVYYIDEAGTDKKIYSKTESGTQGLIRQEGLAADSLCIAGDWLYYSARMAQYGGESSSRIYRLNLQTMELETVGENFRGYVKNMYYLDSLQQIYGEYIPSMADPEDMHGKILVLPIGGQAQVVNDTGARPASEGSDALEFVMADGSRVYCLYHQYSYDSGSGELTEVSSLPIQIEFNGAGL